MGFILLFSILPTFAAEELDAIAAVVGNEVITKSEMTEQLQFLQLSGFIRPEDSLKMDSLEMDLLTQLINRRVLIEYAQEESIEVQEEEIEEMLEGALEDMRSRFPDDETFVQQLEKEGLTLQTFKQNYRRQLKDNLLLQRLMQSEFGAAMFVTEKEIEEFYSVNLDSFAEPLKIELAHILIIPKPSKSEENRVQNKINEVLLRLEFNEDFGDLAKKYSEGEFRNKGGDLGFVKKNDLPPEIADIAFSLKIDELTIARGKNGFHILKCIGKKTDACHIGRIFFAVKITTMDTLRANNLSIKVKALAKEGKDFSSLVKKYSDDIETIPKGGLLGEVYIDQLHPLFKDAVKDLEEGGISEPVQTEFGFHIFKVIAKPEPKTPELDEIKDIVKEYIIQKRTKEKTDELLEKILPGFYVYNFLKKNQ
jgi:peptidyl-prolyl cis-trans isomerase SurA